MRTNPFILVLIFVFGIVAQADQPITPVESPIRVLPDKIPLVLDPSTGLLVVQDPSTKEMSATKISDTSTEAKAGFTGGNPFDGAQILKLPRAGDDTVVFRTPDGKVHSIPLDHNTSYPSGELGNKTSLTPSNI